jgi:hypothetical protein
MGVRRGGKEDNDQRGRQQQRNEVCADMHGKDGELSAKPLFTSLRHGNTSSISLRLRPSVFLLDLRYSKSALFQLGIYS